MSLVDFYYGNDRRGTYCYWIIQILLHSSFDLIGNSLVLNNFNFLVLRPAFELSILNIHILLNIHIGSLILALNKVSPHTNSITNNIFKECEKFGVCIMFCTLVHF